MVQLRLHAKPLLNTIVETFVFVGSYSNSARDNSDVKIFCNHRVFRNLAKCSSLLSWETRKPHANPQTARMTIKENQSTNIQTKHTYRRIRFCNPSSIIWLGVLPYYSSISENLKLHNRI